MTADPVGDDVLARLARLWNDILRGDIVSTPTEALIAALVRLDLAVVPRAQTVKTDGWPAPMVTVGSLVHAASEHAAEHRWAQADALLLHAAMYRPSPRELATYRAVLSAMELVHAAGRDSEPLAAVADQAYVALVDRLGSGP